MRMILGSAAVGVLTAFAGLSADRGETCAVTLRIVDAASGRELPGLVSVTGTDGSRIRPAGLLPRGLGLDDKLPIARWSVLPKATTVELPAGRVVVEAIAGLEHEADRQELDLAGKSAADATLRLRRFSDLGSKGWRSGNTHIHLMKVSRADCDRYLTEVPQADGLDAVFVSYLERAIADQEYTSNRYTRGDLAGLEKASGVRFGNGEEHRHNFTEQGEGYGHVMLLDIRELIQPVSIGPGITKAGTDGLPLQRGIDTARRDGATIVWCHNRWGAESTPNFVTGRVGALNIFDGGAHGSFKDSFYRYWNAGIPVTFSTGTDWFIYDFSRVYADLTGEATVDSWLRSLRGGKTFITNGPLLRLTVNGARPGGLVKLVAGESVQIEAEATGRVDFRRLELVRNGDVFARAATQPAGGHFEARLTQRIDIEGPCWLALRTPPPAIRDDPELAEPAPLNELGKELFAHTTPVAVEVDGKRHIDAATCRAMLAEMEASQELIRARGRFADDAERERVLDVYRDAIREWRAARKTQLE